MLNTQDALKAVRALRKAAVDLLRAIGRYANSGQYGFKAIAYFEMEFLGVLERVRSRHTLGEVVDAACKAVHWRAILCAACWTGHIRAVDRLLQDSLLRSEMCCYQDPFSGWTAFHFAAAAGQLKICQALIDSGLPQCSVDKRGRTPWDLAMLRVRGTPATREGSHDAVCRLLRPSKQVSQGLTFRGGTGSAWESAVADHGQVRIIEWYTMALPGPAGVLGGVHSLLMIRTDEQDYVIEKWASQARRGISVSLWADVAQQIDTAPIHVLRPWDVRPGMTMNTLCGAALCQPPYDLRTYNCHHCALELYNTCAAELAQVQDIPNSYLTAAVEVLSWFGIDLEASQRSSAPVSGGAIAECNVGAIADCNAAACSPPEPAVEASRVAQLGG